MNRSLRENKQNIRKFISMHYTDQRLAEVLAHAQDGKLNLRSCCCLIGAATATHPLQESYADSDVWGECATSHYTYSTSLEGALAAEVAFYNIGFDSDVRRRMLIPILRAEQKRREKLKEGNEIHDSHSAPREGIVARR